MSTRYNLIIVEESTFSLQFVLFLFRYFLIEYSCFSLTRNVLKCASLLPFRHTASLTMYVRKTLLALIHDNGASVCTVYGSDSLKVNFFY